METDERELPLPLGTVISDLYKLIFPLKDHSSNTYMRV